MTEQTFRIEFGESLDGRNAKNFWAGVVVIAIATYLWWNGWFSITLFESGLLERPDGFAAGLTAIALDTIAWLGVTALSVFKFCRPFLVGLVERIGFVALGLITWSADRQQVAVTNEALKQQVRINYELIQELKSEIAELKKSEVVA